MITRVKGTQDLLDLKLLTLIKEKLTLHLKLYHFSPVETPILEHTDLFKRSLGTHTDVVSKEMFLIAPRTDDQEASICLRPEATASLVRAFIENGIEQTPWKVFTWGPMFRYERPQKGRYRQFHQASIEIIGAESLTHDVQLLVMFDRFFHEILGLNSFALLINYLGCSQDREHHKKKLYEFLNDHRGELCGLCLERMNKNILRVFDCKNPQCQTVYVNAPTIVSCLCTSCSSEWKMLQQQLDVMSVNYQLSPTLVRGLDYYNKTVFEFVSSNLGAQNAFCAGGRYDSLVAMLGGKEDQPSIGAAIGIERLLLLLESSNVSLTEEPQPVYLLLPLTKEQHELALLIADEVHAQGIPLEVLFDGSVKSMMRKANKRGASHVILVGSEEQQNRTVTIKHMVSGEQTIIAQTELPAFLKKK